METSLGNSPDAKRYITGLRDMSLPAASFDPSGRADHVPTEFPLFGTLVGTRRAVSLL